MLLRLIYKYFFHNKKRTYRAMLILAINLIIIIGINLMIEAYVSEVQQFSSQIRKTDTRVIINSNTNEDFGGFNSRTYQQILERVDNLVYVDDYYPLLNTITEINTKSSSQRFLNLEITNISKLMERNEIVIGEVLYSDAIVSEDLHNFQELINTSIAFEIKSQIFTSVVNGTFLDLSDRNIDLIIDISHPFIETLSEFPYNKFLIDLADPEYLSKLIRELNDLENITIETIRGDIIFLETSASQLVNLLNILQYSLFLLLIFSITYIMFSLVIETSNDIKIMKAFGLSRYSINAIYVGQALMVGLFGWILASVFSVVFLSSLLGIISGISPLPYTTVELDLSFLLVNFFNTIVISFFSGLIASFKVGW